MRPSLRAVLSLGFMLAFGFGMMIFGSWLTSSYTDSASVLILTSILSLFGAVVSWVIWNVEIGLREETKQRGAKVQQNKSDSLEKRKRDRIDSVLRDLSSDDLMRLRERLYDGRIDDELLYHEMLGDDGELVRMD